MFSLQGGWTEGETDSLLSMVDSQGPAWVVISEELDRAPWDCRDKWRDMMHGRDRKTGEDRLLPKQAITAHNAAQKLCLQPRIVPSGSKQIS